MAIRFSNLVFFLLYCLVSQGGMAALPAGACPYEQLLGQTREANTQSAGRVSPPSEVVGKAAENPASVDLPQLREATQSLQELASEMLQRHEALKENREQPAEKSPLIIAEEVRIHNLANAAASTKLFSDQVLRQLSALESAQATGNREAERAARAELSRLLPELRESTERMRRIAARDLHAPEISPTGVHTFLDRAARISGTQRDPATRVTVAKNFPKEDHVIPMDEVQMLETVENLVVNASRHAFRDRESGILTVGGHYEASVPSEIPAHTTRVGTPKEGKPYFVMEVSDNGRGMDAATRSRIFDAGVTSNSSQGRGLGLASVAEVAKNHGGFVEVTSQPGQGTKFRVYLPMEAMPATQQAAKKPASRYEIDPAQVGFSQERNVVVIDDQDSMAYLTVALLKMQGFKGAKDFTSAHSAAEAFRKEGLPKVAVVDLNMPGERASEYIEGFKAAGIRVVIFSGEASTPQELREQYGVDYVLPKPVDVEPLTATINAALEGIPQPPLRGR